MKLQLSEAERVMLRVRMSGLKAMLLSNAGTTAVSLALAAPVLLGGIGIAVDFGIMQSKRLSLQGAADRAALEAAKELTMANPQAKTIAAAADSQARTDLDSDSSNVSIVTEIGPDFDRVAVTITESWSPFFAHFIGNNITPIQVQATAQLAGKANICVLALEELQAKGLHMDKQARIKANGCGIYSNSIHAEGIRLDRNSSMSAQLICSAGGVKAKTDAVKPTPTTDCPPVQDPLGARKPPEIGPCKETGLVLSTGAFTLSPGNYCGGLKVNGDARVTLRPGEYIMSDGAFEIAADASVIGDGVGIFLSGDKSVLNFTGNGLVELRGAKSGAMAGILFFEDPKAKLARKHSLTGLNVRELTGTIYLPRGELSISPNAPVAAQSDYTAIIAHTLTLNEGPELVLNSNYAGSDVPVPEGVSVATQVVLSE